VPALGPGRVRRFRNPEAGLFILHTLKREPKAMRDEKVLVTGATGYVGGRLVPLLLERGWRVRAAVRSPEKLRGRPWAGHPNLEAAAADVLDRESLCRAADGCSAAFYLVHSMNDRSQDFAEQDRLAARNMLEAADRAGVGRILYLGGLGDDGRGLSEHLRSRHEVARILASGGVPVTHLRAGMILGSGSASFEILRYLVERLPVMITPRWVETPCQPIAIRDVLRYLAGCLENRETAGETLDIGGPEVLTYRRLMEIFAEEAGLRRRLIVPVPVLTPRLSAYWIHLVTPVHASIAQPLARGLSIPVVCRDDRRVAGPDGRGERPAAREAPPAGAEGRGGPGLLACAGGGSSATPAPARGDEDAGRGHPGAPALEPRAGRDGTAAGVELPAPRPLGDRLLVPALPAPCLAVPGHAAGSGPADGTAGPGRAGAVRSGKGAVTGPARLRPRTKRAASKGGASRA